MLKKMIGILGASLLGLSALSGVHASSTFSAEDDIVDVAVSAGNFETLVSAVKAAGLVDTLKGNGPFTVFAPTDEAFDKLPAGTLEDLLENSDALTEVLTYHVVRGQVMAVDVVDLTQAETVQGQSIHIDASNGVKIDDSTVIATDILASNGVIHVIDTVLIPSPISGAGDTMVSGFTGQEQLGWR